MNIILEILLLLLLENKKEQNKAFNEMYGKSMWQGCFFETSDPQASFFKIFLDMPICTKFQVHIGFR